LLSSEEYFGLSGDPWLFPRRVRSIHGDCWGSLGESEVLYMISHESHGESEVLYSGIALDPFEHKYYYYCFNHPRESPEVRSNHRNSRESLGESEVIYMISHESLGESEVIYMISHESLGESVVLYMISRESI